MRLPRRHAAGSVYSVMLSCPSHAPDSNIHAACTEICKRLEGNWTSKRTATKLQAPGPCGWGEAGAGGFQQVTGTTASACPHAWPPPLLCPAAPTSSMPPAGSHLPSHMHTLTCMQSHVQLHVSSHLHAVSCMLLHEPEPYACSLSATMSEHDTRQAISDME